MTNSQKLQEIRNAVDKALESKGLDSTRALKFGCEVEVKYTNVNPRKVATGVFEIGDGMEFVYLASNVGGEGEKVFLKRYKQDTNFIREIIGRDITLEDVLLAMCEADIELYVDTTGDFSESYENDEAEFVINTIYVSDGNGTDSSRSWDFGSPLHLQDEPTINFIYSLLVKEGVKS